MPTPTPSEQELFHAARALPTGAARHDFLQSVCGDPVLRDRVAALLFASDDESFLLSPAAGVPARPASADPEGVGAAVGAYRLVDRVGEGGMGVVYRAEQAEPVRRTVAVKIIRPGLDGRPVLARLEAERRALALMDHPNIARFLDAGATPSGRPYFVMEFIAGEPITRACDARRSPVRERLSLFVAVCRAVQHAHQKGVVHRDLKPSNVLVARYDGAAVPKVIDFGLAKATERPLTESTVVTQFGLVAGTPAYMSPEQADPAQPDIDTRADVYSLGALLYELLTGGPPLPWGPGGGPAGLAEYLRAVRDDDPPRPSARAAQAGPAVAAARGADPKALARALRGDLDWVVMKCLEKDRARRYDTAEALARDIERHLRDEPVEASPPSAGYRARKFARRNRAGLAAAAVFMLLLAGGAGGSGWQAVRATAERDAKDVALRAETAQRERAEAETRRADGEAAVARAVEAFLTDDLLRQAEAGRQDRDVPVRVLLDRAAATVGGKFAGQPRTEAAVRRSLGLTYRSLGAYPEAITHLKRCLELYRETLPPGQRERVQAVNNLAAAYIDGGRYAEAEPLMTESLAAAEAAAGPDGDLALAAANNLAMLYLSAGRSAEAEPLLVRVVDAARRVRGADDPDTLQFASNLGGFYLDRRDWAGAARIIEPVLAARRKAAGDDALVTLSSRNMLGQAYAGLRRYTEAEQLLKDAFAGRRARLAADHPEVLQSMVNLSALYRQTARYAEAEPLCTAALAAARAKIGAGHPRMEWYADAVADLYAAWGNSAAAEPVLRELVTIARGKYGPETPEVGRRHVELARNLLTQKKFAEAEAPARAYLALREKAEPAGWRAAYARSLVGGALMGQGKLAAAEPLLANGYAGLTANAAAIPANARAVLAESREWLARVHDARGHPAEAARVRAGAKPPP